ncbi:unnamed protein product [Paramecium octaurelia]|uniref:Uncharacterized protein n=1 Tax=Paramecium octaurelia TaxID=43137 RepID=A0A8S1TDL5_PAROT|nr:unnamed protein product [Paramecium octaurelia]
MVQCVIGITKVISTSFTQTTAFTDHEGWTISNTYNLGHSSCGGVQLFGGSNEFDQSTGIVKLFTLPPHYKLYLSFVVYIIDMTSEYTINVFLDQALHQIIIPMASSDICRSIQVDQIFDVAVNQFHSFPTTIISIVGSLGQTSVYWGIRDFVLSVDTCPPNCQICFPGSEAFECKQWKLFHSAWNSTDINDFNNDGWYTRSIVGPTTCASIPIYGGYNSMTAAGAMDRQFNLPPHSDLYFIYRFVIIDDWTGQTGNFKIENLNFYSIYNHIGTLRNFCGDGLLADQFHIHGIEFPHDKPSISLLITSDLVDSSKFFGIRDFFIYGYTLSTFCGDGVIDENEQCDDGNNQAFDGCFICEYSCTEGCSACIQGKCYDCQDGWMFDILDDQCIYQQSQDQIEKDQIRDNQLDIHNYQINCIQFNQQTQCIKCKLGYELFEYCQPVCGDGIVAGNEECEIHQKNCNSLCQYQCQEECEVCSFGICQQCTSGYVLKKSECLPKCGDYQIEKQEQCDDGNIVRFDGCHNCQNECQDSCLLCELGQCLMCREGWILENGYCDSKCGDQQIAQGQEECDDGNDIQFDGCYDCKLECPDQGCAVCYLGVCNSCHFPLTLYKEQCLVICGDGLLASGYEDCDDGNDIPYDGCYKCKYQCYKECKTCDRGVCLDECDYGYYLVNQICVPFCGDGIITIDEQCDDANSIEYDGCHQCDYSCPQNCHVCEEGRCYKCNFGFYLNDQKCITKCGDGLIGFPDEECDDYNKNNQDGCDSNCLIETDWTCTQPSEDSFSQCSYMVAPAMKLTYITQEYNFQYVELSFTQKVRCYVQNYTSYINATLFNFSADSYRINIIETTAANYTLQSVNYEFKIEILEQVKSDIILEISLNEQLYNGIEMNLVKQSSSIKLNEPKLLNQNQLTVSSSLQEMNKIILYISCSIGLLYLMFGKIGVFLDILDILQQQSYLKYINVEIPQNLKIYYESSNAISFQPFLQYLNLNTLSSNQLEFQYIEAKYKFKEYEVNADIAANLQLFLIIVTTVFISKFIFKQLLKYLFKSNIPMIQQYKFQLHSTFTLIISKLYFNFAKQGLQVIIYSNSFDLLFISCIQLSVDCDLYRTLLSVWIIVFTTLVIIQPKKNRQQNSVIIVKKLAYIMILVFYQSCQIVQSILLSLIQTFYMSFLISQQKSMSLQFLKQFMAEVSMLFTLVMNFSYWDELMTQLNYQNKVDISWSQIALLTSSLASIILVETYNSFLNIYKKVQQKMKGKPCNSKQPFEQMIVF